MQKCCFLQIPEQGNADAQCEIGKLYCTGQGIAQDYKKAYEWYTIAASSDFTPALYNLACMYYLGEYAELDYSRAFELFLRAANQDDADAQFFVGKMLFNGEGTEFDADEAMNWLRKAAENGNPHATSLLSSIHN